MQIVLWGVYNSSEIECVEDEQFGGCAAYGVIQPAQPRGGRDCSGGK